MKHAPTKHLYVIAGSNGAGKTTFAREFLPAATVFDSVLYAQLLREAEHGE